MKRVVNSRQVAHLWANQSQTDARNGSNSVSFDGPDYRSYRTVVARIVKSNTGEPVALFTTLTTRNYSVTTAKHISRAGWAARHLPSYDVPELWPNAEGHAVNLARLANRYTEAVARYNRATGTHWGTDEDPIRESLHGLALEAQSYAAHFGLTVPEFNLEADVAAIVARFARLAERRADPKHQAKLERARERRAERRDAANLEAARERWDGQRARWDLFRDMEPDLYFDTVAGLDAIGDSYSYELMWRLIEFEQRNRERLALIRNAEAVARWRKGENVHVPYDVPTVLRVKSDGATVQTSRGAEVPLRDAARLYALVAQCRARGAGWETNGHTFHVGAFKVDRISPEGELRAGCHVIGWAEIEAFAIAQGWATAGPATASAEISGEGVQL